MVNFFVGAVRHCPTLYYEMRFLKPGGHHERVRPEFFRLALISLMIMALFAPASQILEPKS